MGFGAGMGMGTGMNGGMGIGMNMGMHGHGPDGHDEKTSNCSGDSSQTAGKCRQRQALFFDPDVVIILYCVTGCGFIGI